jgi:hypothetical protein
MLKTVAVKDLRPNPFRRLDEYSIIREKVDALKESIDTTGFWSNILGRPREDGTVEIAFGHHRLAALRELGAPCVDMIVQDLTDEEMLRIMANENMQEWSSSAWVEMDAVRAVIDAYAKGEIELPPARPKTSASNYRYASQAPVKQICTEEPVAGDASQAPVTHTYTKLQVAEFLGWTRKNSRGGLQIDFKCTVAFEAIDMINRGLLQESSIRGLTRTQLQTLVQQQSAVYNSEIRKAELNEQYAKTAREDAKDASLEEWKQAEKRAAGYEREASDYRTVATQKAVALGERGSDAIRDADASLRDMRKMATSMRAVEHSEKVHSMSDYVYKTCRKIEKLFYGADTYSSDLTFLKHNMGDLSSADKEMLVRTMKLMINRFKSWALVFAEKVDSPSGSYSG